MLQDNKHVEHQCIEEYSIMATVFIRLRGMLR